MNTWEYTVVMEPNDDEPGFTATVPALPGCVSWGDTVEEALENIKDAIEVWIRAARKKGEPIPTDKTQISKVAVAA